MKNHIKHKIAVLLIGVVITTFLFSCKKELANELTNATYVDEFWKKESDVNAAVAGAYGLFRNSLTDNACFFIWGDSPVGQFSSDNGTLTTDLFIGDFRAPYRSNGAHSWVNWYKVVDLTNLIIERVDKMPDAVFTSKERKNYLLGEAYFLRGLSYFYMTRTWGDVPLRLTATTADNVLETEYIPATGTVDIIKQVIADGKKASALLSWQGATEYQKRRASKGAALALLAHATAWRTPVGTWQNGYGKAIVYIDSILTRTDQFNLQAKGNIRAVFKEAKEPENIFVLSARDTENESSAWTGNRFDANIAYITIGNDTKAGMPLQEADFFLEEEKIKELYEPDDARIEDFYRIRQSTINTAANTDMMLWKYSDIAFKGANASGPTEPRAESNLIIFRLADMILLKAEALNALGRDGEALIELNKIRTRSNASLITRTGQSLRQEILLERRRELIGEGHNYFDMVRTGLFLEILWNINANSRAEQKGYYWPVSNNSLSANRYLTQIPYWNGRY